MKVTRRGRPIKRKTPYKAPVVRKIARQEANKVMKQNTEVKQAYMTQSAYGIDWDDGVVFDVNSQISAGNADNQRIGEWITPKSLHIKGCFSYGDSTNICRLIVMQYKASGSNPTLDVVLHSVGNVRAPFSPYADSYRSSFRVLYDRTFLLNNQSRPQAMFNIKLNKLRKIKIVGDGDDVHYGGIYVLALSDSGAEVNPTIQWQGVLRYVDA